MKTRTLILVAAALALPAAARAGGTPNLHAWADSIAPDLIAMFEAETGTTVNVDSRSSNEDLLTKLQAGSSGCDLVMPSQHFARILTDQGLALDIDAKDMAAVRQVDPKWRGRGWGETSDRPIPMAYGTAGFTVNRITARARPTAGRSCPSRARTCRAGSRFCPVPTR